MIARYSQIQQQVQILSSHLSRPGHVQKIFSTSRYLCLQIRLPGKTLCLYLGRGHGHEGLWLGEELPPPFLRLRDRWLEWCRKNFTSALLTAIRMDSLDRAIALDFQKSGERQTLYLAWVGRQCHFALYASQTKTWMTGWQGSFEGVDGFDIFDQVGRRESNQGGVLEAVPLIGDLLKIEAQAAKMGQSPKKKIKSQEVKLVKIRNDLQRISQWKSLQAWLTTVPPEDLALSEQIQHLDLRYKFPVGLNGWQRRDWLYGQIKRLKQAELLQTERYQQQQNDLLRLRQGPANDENTLRPKGPHWKLIKPKLTTAIDAQGDYSIHSFEGYKIGVGRSAQGNDQLRKSWASDEDHWVHALNATSAHAIIKLTTGSGLGPEQIQEAAKIIAKQSGITATQLEVITASVKNVRGVTGAPGMVTYKKSKKLLCLLS